MTSAIDKRPDIIGERLPGVDGGHPRYLIVDTIGTGGQAWVFRAQDEKLGRDVAIKILRPDKHDGYSEGYQKRFKYEAKFTAVLQGAHTVTVFDHGTSRINGFDYLVMCSEFIDGITLHQHITNNGALKLLDCIVILQQIAMSLREAHARGFIHRDLKSMNVMMSHGPSAIPNVKVLDFGISKAIRKGSKWDGNLTQQGDNFLSPMFSAPEQLDKKAPLDARTDLYALGLIAYHCLVGLHPYHHLMSDQMAVLTQVVSPDCVRLPVSFQQAPLTDIVHKLLEKIPDRRYQSCGDLLEDLNNLETTQKRNERLTQQNVRVSREERPSPDPKGHTDRLDALSDTDLQMHSTIPDAQRTVPLEVESTRPIRASEFDPFEDKKTSIYESIDRTAAPEPEEREQVAQAASSWVGPSTGPMPADEPMSTPPRVVRPTQQFDRKEPFRLDHPVVRVGLVAAALCLVFGLASFVMGPGDEPASNVDEMVAPTTLAQPRGQVTPSADPSSAAVEPVVDDEGARISGAATLEQPDSVGSKVTEPRRSLKSVTKEPEPAKAEPEPAKAEPEPAKAEPESSKVEPEPAKAEPEPAKAEPEPAKVEPEPAKVEPAKVASKKEKPGDSEAVRELEPSSSTEPEVANPEKKEKRTLNFNGLQ